MAKPTGTQTLRDLLDRAEKVLGPDGWTERVGMRGQLASYLHRLEAVLATSVEQAENETKAAGAEGARRRGKKPIDSESTS
jgi:hypothetical protein